MTPIFDPNNHLASAYHVLSEFAFISKNTTIPESALAEGRSHGIYLYSAGLGNALIDLLCGEIGLKHTDQGLEVIVAGEGRVLIGRDGKWFARSRDAEELKTTPIAGYALALTSDLLPQTAQRLRSLIRKLGMLNLAFPFRRDTLITATNNAVIKEAVMQVTDALDYELSKLEITVEEGILRGPLQGEDLNLAALVRGVSTQFTASTPEMKLQRLVRRGGSALLIGPPGTFKTETAKRVAVEQHLSLIIAKGAPGVEDRDFIGGLYPSPNGNGAVWIDGPLSRAFYSASRQPTLLLIDEVLRYHPENLNVIIGAMDTVSTKEALAIGIPESELTGKDNMVDHSGRWYLLPLPNGDVLTAPYRNLLWVFTTNIGGDHLQTADRFDGALLSRLDHIIEYTYPDEAVATRLYTEIAEDSELADLVYRAELLTREMMQEEDRALARSLEARKSIALIKEIRALEKEGTERMAAFMDAFESIAVPYCVPRDMDGALDSEVVALLKSRLTEELFI